MSKNLKIALIALLVIALIVGIIGYAYSKSKPKYPPPVDPGKPKPSPWDTLNDVLQGDWVQDLLNKGKCDPENPGYTIGGEKKDKCIDKPDTYCKCSKPGYAKGGINGIKDPICDEGKMQYEIDCGGN